MTTPPPDPDPYPDAAARGLRDGAGGSASGSAGGGTAGGSAGEPVSETASGGTPGTAGDSAEPPRLARGLRDGASAGGSAGSRGGRSAPGSAGRGEVLREALRGLLGAGEGGPGAEDVADVVWVARLAGLVGAGEDAGPGGGERPAAVAPGRPGPVPEPPPRDRAEAGPVADPPAARVGLYPLTGKGKGKGAGAGTSSGTGTGPVDAPRGPAAHVVRVAQPQALSGALDLARALRPLRQSVPSPGPELLDEDATAQATGEAAYLLPVWRPASERRFSVDLLVDTGATMAVWHRLAGELCTVLERHGAFAEVRCWSLATGRDTPELAPFRRRMPAAPKPPVRRAGRWSAPLEDPTGRALLLVLTDGVGPAWYGRELPEFLARTAGERPAAALQVLPRRLWHRTALRTVPVELRVPDPARPVADVRTDAAVPGLPRDAAPAGVRWLPVMEVDGAWLAPWAGLVAGRVPGWSPMLAAPVGGAPRPVRSEPAPTPTPPPSAVRVARFRSGCSPDAFRLACHLAAAPLSLPVMRIVQQATVPGSGQSDLAELFLSGLIERRSDEHGGDGHRGDELRRDQPRRDERPPDPDEVVYDFAPGVRDALLAELTRTESLHVLDDVLSRVSGRVAATFGGTLDFRALAALARGTAAEDVNGAGEGGGRPLPERSLPFAEVAAAVLGGAGGQHRALARQLAAAAAGRALEPEPEPAPDADRATGPGTVPADPAPPPVPHPDLLVPVPPITSPPDPIRMIGRMAELAAMERTLRPTPDSPREELSVVLIEGRKGTGRTRLVQEYVRRHGARHSFVHRIDARTRQTLEDGLSALRYALTPGPVPPIPTGRIPTDVWDALAEHRDWLLVFDRLRSHGRGVAEALEDCLPLYGHGSVIVTAGDLEDATAADATVLPLGELTRAEIMEHLTASIDPGLLALDRGIPSRLYELAQRLPTSPVELAATNVRALFAAQFAAPPGAPPRPLYEWARAHGDRGLVGYVAGGGVWLAAAGFGRGVHLWDSAEGATEGVALTPDGLAVQTLTGFSDANGRPMIAVAGSGGAVAIWDAVARERVRVNVTPGGFGIDTITTFTGRDRRTVLMTGGWDVAARLWDVETGAEVPTALTQAAGLVRAVAVVTDADGDALAVLVGRERTIRVWDMATDTERPHRLPPRLGGVRALAAVPNHPGMLAAVTDDGDLELWDIATGTVTAALDTEGDGRLVAVSAFNGLYGRPLLATASADGRAQVWDLASLPAPREPFAEPDFPLWLLDFLDGGSGVPTSVVAALWQAHADHVPDSPPLPPVGDLAAAGLVALEETAVRPAEAGRTALRERITAQRSADFVSRLVRLLGAMYPAPTDDPASWAPYASPRPSFDDLVARALQQSDLGVPGDADTALTLLLNWTSYHLLHGDPLEARHIVTLAEEWGTTRQAAGAPERQVELNLLSLRALTASGSVSAARWRCELLLASRPAVQDPAVHEETLLRKAELALWQGEFTEARETLERGDAVLPAGRTLARSWALHRLTTGDLAGAWQALGASNPTAGLLVGDDTAYRDQEFPWAGTDRLRASLAVVRDELTGSVNDRTGSLIDNGLRLMRMRSGPSAGPADLPVVQSAVPHEYFDVYVAFTELLVESLVQRATGPLWYEGAAGRRGLRSELDPAALDYVRALEAVRGRSRLTAPHLYARFKATEGSALLAVGDHAGAASSLSHARAMTGEVYGVRSPLLPRIGLLLARALHGAGDVRGAHRLAQEAEGVLDVLYGPGRPHQDRVTALRARTLLAGTAAARAEAAAQETAMAAALLRP